VGSLWHTDFTLNITIKEMCMHMIFKVAKSFRKKFIMKNVLTKSLTRLKRL